MMNVALSYNHCLIDGRDAVLFLKAIIANLETPEKLLLNL
jgi:2-oxoglutarate dehydrogenase E2 component (dihydrolipoamide succinyltransferase)